MKKLIITAAIAAIALSACTQQEIADAVKLDADRRAAVSQVAASEPTPLGSEPAPQQTEAISPDPGASGCSAELSNHGYPSDPTLFVAATARCTTLGPGGWVVARVLCHNGVALTSPKQFNAGVDTSATWDSCWRRAHSYADSADFATGVG